MHNQLEPVTDNMPPMSDQRKKRGNNWNRRSPAGKSRRMTRSNNKKQSKHLSYLLEEYFGGRNAYFATFDFHSEQLPTTYDACVSRFRKYLREIRADFRRHGKELVFIYAVHGESAEENKYLESVSASKWETTPWRDSEKWESLSIPGESKTIQIQSAFFHVHSVFLLQAEDIETLLAFWPCGAVSIQPLPTEATNLRRLAEFFMIERWAEITPKSRRAYIPCQSIGTKERKERTN